MKKLFSILAVMICIPAFAQISMPQPSPKGSFEQRVGLTDISMEYSRPGVKDRVIFGDLVPYGEMWRTGANASTKIEFSSDVVVEGNEVPAGKYALYMIPGKDKWTVVLHKNLSYWGTGGKDYKESEDQCRFDVKPNAYPAKVETMTFMVSDIRNESCNIEFLWENTQVKFKVETEVDKLVMAEIKEKMQGVTASTYYQSARYYLENDKDLDQALEWINKALETTERYWIVRQKALILAKLERYDEAITAAERSKALAEEAGNKGYVKMNDESIAEWKKK